MNVQSPYATEESRFRLLIVEDDPAISDVLSQLFAAEGCSTVTTDTGAGALDIVASEPIDLVLLDVLLPDRTGYDVAAQLRAAGDARLPIVMLTALDTPDHVVSGLAHGADDYVAKPFDPGELVLRVTGLLRRAERERVVQQHADAMDSEVATERALRSEQLQAMLLHLRALHRAAGRTAKRMPAGPLREVVEQLYQRIRGTALMYEISATLQRAPVDAGAMLQTITVALKELYQPWRRVKVVVRGPEALLPAAAAAPLALLVNELVTNALRHAFPDQRFGTVTVSYATVGDALDFSVADDGVGFDMSAPASGRGRVAVDQLGRELGGYVTWVSSAAGTNVSGRLPLAVESDQREATAG